jgi:hypothetical protein
MDSSAIRAGRVLFSAATLVALGFGAHTASASMGAAGDRTITCTFKTSSAPKCVTSCESRGLYYYQWYPATQNCCCSSIAP